MSSTMTPRDLEFDARAIREMSARWLRAVDARDAMRTAAFYGADGVFLAPNVPLAQGRDAIRTVWEQLLAAPNLSLAWTPTCVHVACAGDMACEIGSYRLGMDGPSGRIEDDGKYVVVWQKSGGDWQVAADAFNSNRALAS